MSGSLVHQDLFKHEHNIPLNEPKNKKDEDERQILREYTQLF